MKYFLLSFLRLVVLISLYLFIYKIYPFFNLSLGDLYILRGIILFCLYVYLIYKLFQKLRKIPNNDKPSILINLTKTQSFRSMMLKIIKIYYKITLSIFYNNLVPIIKNTTIIHKFTYSEFIEKNYIYFFCFIFPRIILSSIFLLNAITKQTLVIIFLGFIPLIFRIILLLINTWAKEFNLKTTRIYFMKIMNSKNKNKFTEYFLLGKNPKVFIKRPYPVFIHKKILENTMDFHCINKSISEKQQELWVSYCNLFVYSCFLIGWSYILINIFFYK